MENLYREKAFYAEKKKKKSGKMTLPSQKNFPVTPLKLACFVLYLKIINIFLKNNICIL